MVGRLGGSFTLWMIGKFGVVFGVLAGTKVAATGGTNPGTVGSLAVEWIAGRGRGNGTFLVAAKFPALAFCAVKPTAANRARAMPGRLKITIFIQRLTL